MVAHTRTPSAKRRRRAIVAVQVGVMLVVLIGMAALTIDVGQLYAARAELQRAADSAALAGASAYTTDLMMTVRQETGGSAALAEVKTLAISRVHEYSTLNMTLGSPTVVESADIQTGWMNLNSGSEAIHDNPAPKDYNAVYVMARRMGGEGQDSNGGVPLFFAPIFGQFMAESSASAVAAFDDRVSGFNTGAPNAANILPFTVHRDAFYQDVASGGDSYGYDEATSSVIAAGDGIREVRLYPFPLSGSGYTEGDGNFGILNIGTGNQGVEAERTQILEGASPSDFEAEVGTSDLTFYDDDGNPTTYDITGSPGLEATLQDTISGIIGEVIGFFLHTNVVMSGSNAIYTITELRFGRIMDIRLIGQPSLRGMYVQPVSFSGAGVKIDPDAPSTDGMVGLIVLVR